MLVKQRPGTHIAYLNVVKPVVQ